MAFGGIVSADSNAVAALIKKTSVKMTLLFGNSDRMRKTVDILNKTEDIKTSRMNKMWSLAIIYEKSLNTSIYNPEILR